MNPNKTTTVDRRSNVKEQRLREVLAAPSIKDALLRATRVLLTQQGVTEALLHPVVCDAKDDQNRSVRLEACYNRDMAE